MDRLSDNISVTALVVALVALLVTSCQLLQQVYSTAEGYRRCQPSVLGSWAQHTRLVWRWSQFRFEVKFTTPNIVMENTQIKHKPPNRPQTLLDIANVIPLDPTGVHNPGVAVERNLETDTVSWIKLLRNLQSQQWTTLDNIHLPEPKVSICAMTLREWSWDLLPDEVSRPIATMTISTLITVTHRLGMAWRDLRPSEGFLRAEGNGQSVSATNIRGLGLLIQYNVETSIFEKSLTDKTQLLSLRIPSEDADKMGYGIIPGCSDLSLLDTPCLIGSAITNTRDLSGVKASLQAFGVPASVAMDMINSKYTYSAMYDFMFMTMPFLSPYGSRMVEVFNPLRVDRTGSYLRARELRLVLRVRLNEYVQKQKNPSAHIRNLQKHFDSFATSFWGEFMNSISYEQKHLYPSTKVIEHCHTVWDELTEWFKGCQDRKTLNYKDLVIEHLTCNVKSLSQADQNLESGKHRDNQKIVTGPRARGFVEVSHIYADNVDKVVAKLLLRGYSDEAFLADAVWTLLVRAMYCGFPLLFLPEQSYPAAPSDFWESRTPLYII